MLTSIRMRNFRCFDDHTIPLRPRTIIVGRNNAGKSTVIEALRLVSLVTNRFGRLQTRYPPRWIDTPVGNPAGVIPALPEDDFNFETLYHRYGSPPAIVEASFASGDRVAVYVGGENELWATAYDASGASVNPRGAGAMSRLPRVSILPQIGPLLVHERILDRDYVRRSVSTDLASLHFRNQLVQFQEYFEDFKRISEETWPHLQVREIARERGRIVTPMQLMVRDTDFVAEVGRMGHGLQMWLQTMWFLARTKSDPTIILDEPDVYMHADTQRRLIRFLRTRYNQTIVATHSVEILAEADPDDVLVIDRTQPSSYFASSVPSVQAVINSMGGVHNLSLTRLWSSRRCLMIEGEDIQYLKVIHEILFPHALEPLDSLPRVSLGGWSGFQYAIGSRMLLQNSGGEEIIPYCLLDSDYHTQEEIDAKTLAAKRAGIELHIWGKKEIENYLLVPHAIHRLLAERLGDRAPSAELIAGRLDEIAAELRDSVTDAIANEELDRDRRKGLPHANKLARERVSARWSTQQDRWSIVGGKDVFSRISKWCQDTFGTSISPIAVARRLRASELSGEITKVLSAIEAVHRFD
jgi:hypothetical protein